MLPIWLLTVIIVGSILLLGLIITRDEPEKQENLSENEDMYEIKLYEGYRVSDVSKTFKGPVSHKNFHRLIFPFNLKSYTVNIPKLPQGRTMYVKMTNIYPGTTTASTLATGVGSSTYVEPEYTRTASPSKYKVIDEFKVLGGQSVSKAVDITEPVKKLMVTIIVV